VGFTGGYVIARCAPPLAAFDLVVALGGATVSSARRSDDWQLLVLSDVDPAALERLPAPLARLTGSPVMVAVVHDSDLAFVSASCPDGLRWETVLNPQTAADYGFAPATERSDLAPELSALLPPPAGAVVEEALHWSVDAGFRPDPGVVLAALRANHLFAEEAVAGLAEALGVWVLEAG